jgi:histidyl-tRNA synthetase
MINKPKGTYDVYGNYGKKLLELENMFKNIMLLYNYEYIRTPIFESSNLFHRGVGETTDIVSKETYDFKDRGARDMTLRPEGTAGVVRAYIENKIYADPNVPAKYWYYGPMYRYERPQSGRFREFYQFGVEAFGSNDPSLDAEVISIPVNIYKLLGLCGVKVKVNSLGDMESRNNYKEALLKHFKPHINELCSDCKERYEKNPLRILDCKVDTNHESIQNAPIILDYLNEESKKHFEDVKKYLNASNIEYEVDPNIVRGLDYYTHTVFEVEANIGDDSKMNILCGGGRYNKMVETVGGPDTSGVGFALGLERLLGVLEKENIEIPYEDEIDCYIIPLTENEKEESIKLLTNLRMNAFKADTDYLNRNVKSNFKQADRLKARFIILIGEEEVKSEIYTIKNNQTKEEFKINKANIIDFLDEQDEDHIH